MTETPRAAIIRDERRKLYASIYGRLLKIEKALEQLPYTVAAPAIADLQSIGGDISDPLLGLYSTCEFCDSEDPERFIFHWDVDHGADQYDDITLCAFHAKQAREYYERGLADGTIIPEDDADD